MIKLFAGALQVQSAHEPALHEMTFRYIFDAQS